MRTEIAQQQHAQYVATAPTVMLNAVGEYPTVGDDAMKFVLAISAALILVGCSDHTPPAKRAASPDSGSLPTARQSDSTQYGDYGQVLIRWRSYRIGRNQVSGGDDYTKGFQQGYTGPPGLVDGSPDFNLGHSDGMQAKMGILPKRPAAGDGE